MRIPPTAASAKAGANPGANARTNPGAGASSSSMSTNADTSTGANANGINGASSSASANINANANASAIVSTSNVALTRQRDAAPSVATTSRVAAGLQSDLLQPALAALRAMPEVDLARVAQLRDALAGGALPFDAHKLAGLIQRFHGVQS